MNKICVEHNPSGIDGLAVITPPVHYDSRGFFLETYNLQDLKAEGICAEFVQDNQSLSTKGVLRGLHYQKKYPQAKMVRVLSGSVFDVAVDLRINSQTFGKWHGIELSSDNKKQFYIPQGFAHGFLVLSTKAEFCYKVTDYYHPEDEYGILWNDVNIDVKWPLHDIFVPILSEKDKSNSPLPVLINNVPTA